MLVELLDVSNLTLLHIINIFLKCKYFMCFPNELERREKTKTNDRPSTAKFFSYTFEKSHHSSDELKRISKCQEQICRFCKFPLEKFVMSFDYYTK